MHNKFSTRMPDNTRWEEKKNKNYTAIGGDSVQAILHILIFDMRNQDLFKTCSTHSQLCHRGGENTTRTVTQNEIQPCYSQWQNSSLAQCDCVFISSLFLVPGSKNKIK